MKMNNLHVKLVCKKARPIDKMSEPTRNLDFRQSLKASTRSSLLGAKSLASLEVQKLGFPTKFKDFKIQNMVGGWLHPRVLFSLTPSWGRDSEEM